MNDQLKTMEYVHTGEVKAGGTDIILNSGAIGSCVVIVAFDSRNKIGAMAHVMLPGHSPRYKNTSSTKYAKEAVVEIQKQLSDKGAEKENTEVCILGGANVLKRENDTIGNDNIKSVEELLNDLGLTICAKSLGGTERRTALLNIEEACVYYTEGDSKEKVLWYF